MVTAPFCAWCGGDCQCDALEDDDEIERRESFFCDCLAEGSYDEYELATGRCACCGGQIQD